MLLHNGGYWNECVRKRTVPYSIMLLFHNGSMIKRYKLIQMLCVFSCSGSYWFSFKGKAHTTKFRLGVYAFQDPPLCSSILLGKIFKSALEHAGVDKENASPTAGREQCGGFSHPLERCLRIVNFKGLKLTLKNFVRFSSPTTSRAVLRSKYQYFDLYL